MKFRLADCAESCAPVGKKSHAKVSAESPVATSTVNAVEAVCAQVDQSKVRAAKLATSFWRRGTKSSALSRESSVASRERRLRCSLKSCVIKLSRLDKYRECEAARRGFRPEHLKRAGRKFATVDLPSRVRLRRGSFPRTRKSDFSS